VCNPAATLKNAFLASNEKTNLTTHKIDTNA
jgi:hypothetical protein